MSKAPAADYALEIIEYIARKNTGVGIADISNALGINKNAVSRILESLTEHEWCYMCDTERKKYRLTRRPFSILSESLSENMLVSAAMPCLSELHEKFGDAVYLGVKNGGNVLYLIHLDSSKEVRVNGRVGGEYPLGCSAPGKALLAFGEENDIDEYFRTGVERRTKNTVTSCETFKEQAEEIRKCGFALDLEEFAGGIICAASPVFDSSGKAVAAVGISTLTIYDDKQTLVKEKAPAVAETAKRISAVLGFCTED